jgi:hypothetical protein
MSYAWDLPRGAGPVPSTPLLAETGTFDALAGAATFRELNELFARR